MDSFGKPKMKALPSFKYHPDPIATGAVIVQDATCICCRLLVDHVYTASAYTVNEIRGKICPWCISDGSAANRLSVEFLPPYAVQMCNVPDTVVDEVVRRTPGYHSWQEEAWIGHCNDACAYLGCATPDQCSNATPEAVDRFAESLGIGSEEARDTLMKYNQYQEISIHRFLCLHCGTTLFHGEYA